MTRGHCPFKSNRQHLGVTFIPPKPIILWEQCVAMITEPAVTSFSRGGGAEPARGHNGRFANFMCVMVYGQNGWMFAQTQ